MNRSLKIFLLALIFVIITYPSLPPEVNAETESGYRIEFNCPLSGGRIGDPLAFSLRVKLPKNAFLELSSLNSLKIIPLKSDGRRLAENFFSCAFSPFNQLGSAPGQSFTIQGSIRFYAPGDFQLGPVTLLYRKKLKIRSQSPADTPEKPEIGTLTSNRIKIHIARLQSGSHPLPALIIPDKNPPFTLTGRKKLRSRQQLYRISLILSLLITLFFAVSCYRRRKQESLYKIKTPPRKTAEIAAELRKALQPRLIDSHWRHLAEIDHLLRGFLLQETHLTENAAGGRGTTFMEQLASHLEPEAAARLQLIWAEIDRIVALELDKSQDFPKLCTELRLWLKRYSKNRGGGYGF